MAQVLAEYKEHRNVLGLARGSAVPFAGKASQ